MSTSPSSSSVPPDEWRLLCDPHFSHSPTQEGDTGAVFFFLFQPKRVRKELVISSSQSFYSEAQRRLRVNISTSAFWVTIRKDHVKGGQINI